MLHTPSDIDIKVHALPPGVRAILVARYARLVSEQELADLHARLTEVRERLGISFIIIPQELDIGVSALDADTLPWCIARFAIDGATGQPSLLRPEIMRDLLCEDVSPHNLCGPLSRRGAHDDPYVANRLYIGAHGITDHIERFATREEAEALIAGHDRPRFVRDVPWLLKDIHFFVVSVDPRGVAPARKLYDGGSYDAAVLIQKLAQVENITARCAHRVTIHVRPAPGAPPPPT